MKQKKIVISKDNYEVGDDEHYLDDLEDEPMDNWK